MSAVEGRPCPAVGEVSLAAGRLLARVHVGALSRGDEVRETRSAQPYRVAAVAWQHEAWAVRGYDAATRRYSPSARLLRVQGHCEGQTTLPLEAS